MHGMAVSISVLVTVVGVSHLLEVLSLVPFLSKLRKGHVKELQQNYGWEAR